MPYDRLYSNRDFPLIFQGGHASQRHGQGARPEDHPNAQIATTWMNDQKMQEIIIAALNSTRGQEQLRTLSNNGVRQRISISANWQPGGANHDALRAYWDWARNQYGPTEQHQHGDDGGSDVITIIVDPRANDPNTPVIVTAYPDANHAQPHH
eukprot:CAMPEP_0118822320 /NCGR_PEP_ID=MMETSP1162-20130426/9091_1 /TAXON_ID=33656 /ORGANISM="Phaeocystis Sp, Strain CCMP2710" /LENGTH=152 /DNA_ID=CAMNT_0006752855 /DNA_START=260 /DNA_END=718 /DNA_ORIENTATION=+